MCRWTAVEVFAGTTVSIPAIRPASGPNAALPVPVLSIRTSSAHPSNARRRVRNPEDRLSVVPLLNFALFNPLVPVGLPGAHFAQIECDLSKTLIVCQLPFCDGLHVTVFSPSHVLEHG